jgi:photosynthetic reaction center cytochrome c subunit
MTIRRGEWVFGAAGMLGICVLAAAMPGAQSGPPRSDPQKPKVAEEVFKNIQVLKGTPAGQLIPAMHVFTASLGVTCDYCHLEDRSKDDKKAKQTARKMIQMMFVINKDNFENHREVTCYSCHHGAEVPPAIPSLFALYNPNPPPPEDSDAIGDPQPGSVPTADQLLEKYVQALGGAQKIANVTSLVEKGTVEIDQQQAPVEVFVKAPGQRVMVMHLANGDSTTTYDGHAGWRAEPESPVRAMNEGDLDASKMDADLSFPLHLKQYFRELRVGFRTTIDDRDVNVVMGAIEGKPPVKLYFDEKSGLLMRLVRYADSAVGREPSQIDYADYRDTSGPKLPFRWTVTQLNGRFTVQLNEVQQNIPVDDAKFTKPIAPPQKPPKP